MSEGIPKMPHEDDREESGDKKSGMSTKMKMGAAAASMAVGGGIIGVDAMKGDFTAAEKEQAQAKAVHEMGSEENEARFDGMKAQLLEVVKDPKVAEQIIADIQQQATDALAERNLESPMSYSIGNAENPFQQERDKEWNKKFGN